MAKRRPSQRPGSQKGSADDAFTAGILEFLAWARRRTEVLIALVVVLVLLAGGTIYYLNQRSVQRAQAASELESIQQIAAFQEPDEAIAELEDFLTRFGGTPYGVEARLVLAELLLDEGRPGEAVEALAAEAPSFRDPLRLQATILLASALEEAERWERAAEVYEALSREAEFSYQRRDATEGLARVHLAREDTAAAAAAYRAILEEGDLPPDQRGYYEMRLAEVTGGEPS